MFLLLEVVAPTELDGLALRYGDGLDCRLFFGQLRGHVLIAYFRKRFGHGLVLDFGKLLGQLFGPGLLQIRAFRLIEVGAGPARPTLLKSGTDGEALPAGTSTGAIAEPVVLSPEAVFARGGERRKQCAGIGRCFIDIDADDGGNQSGRSKKSKAGHHSFFPRRLDL